MSYWEKQGKSDEWYTPKYIFDALGVIFDLDVAAPKSGPLHVPCRNWFYENALSKDWFGLVWMNAPFGARNSLVPWLDRFFAHGNGIALTPDRTSSPWFQEACQMTDGILFMPKVKFIRADGSVGKSPSNGTALWAVGATAMEALSNGQSNGLGVFVKPFCGEAA
ncbi:adenine methyltransferase [Altererythrobacter indicus]|uniref:Adenine methyltransferase n=1 Tax=Altericroceibacterium indicum TaxID=374177 RepID=A0A845ACC3_9SPHN|nr:DNA N-6-adenine-methyltransferase [Altericroceibacterium indicum]MXP24828.1 adenine methyltransferase [Altericroceibacterium indicum]